MSETSPPDLPPGQAPRLNDEQIEQVQSVAMHEAGHYVVARALGFRCEGLSVELGRRMGATTHRGRSFIHVGEDVGDSVGIAAFIERRVQVLLAGVMAQSLEDSGLVDQGAALRRLEVESRIDLARFEELTALLRNIHHGADQGVDFGARQTAELKDECWDRAVALVEQEQALIRGLAATLARRVKEIGVEYRLTEEDIHGMDAMQKRFGPFPHAAV